NFRPWSQRWTTKPLFPQVVNLRKYPCKRSTAFPALLNFLERTLFRLRNNPPHKNKQNDRVHEKQTKCECTAHRFEQNGGELCYENNTDPYYEGTKGHRNTPGFCGEYLRKNHPRNGTKRRRKARYIAKDEYQQPWSLNDIVVKAQSSTDETNGHSANTPKKQGLSSCAVDQPEGHEREQRINRSDQNRLKECRLIAQSNALEYLRSVVDNSINTGYL